MSVALFTLLFLAQPIVRRDALACSECMCGTPFPADALGGVVPAQIRYGFEDRYLSKSNALDEEPGEEEEREHRVSAFAVWRPRDRFALLARVPYNVKEIRETPLGEATTTQTSRGLGDAEAVALIGLAQSSSMRPATLGLVLGISVPTGANGLRGRGGERLDEHLQPGTGAWSATGGLNLGVSPRGSIVEAGVLARANAEGSHHYR